MSMCVSVYMYASVCECCVHMYVSKKDESVKRDPKISHTIHK